MYSGHETKLLKNSSKAPLKWSNIDKTTNSQIVFLFLILIVIALASALGSQIVKNNGDDHSYISADNDNDSFFFNVLTFFILYNNLIPISLLVTIEFVKFIQAYYINKDSEMYHKATDTYALARTSNLNEELGQIKYVFSDKTGTLTENIMNFKECSIAGEKFSSETLDSINAENERDPNAIRLAASSSYGNFQANENSKLFFVSMAVCHTVIPERLEGGQTGEVEYNASSPDEKALVEGAAHFGFQFIERHPNTVEVKIEGQNIEEFEVLDTIEFTSTRKRMSCVTRFPNGKICLLIKGADNIINDRLGPSERTHRQYLSSTFGHLEDFARKGLRTLCFAVRDIPEAEYKAWKEEYIEACNAIENREEKVEEVAAKLERDLTLIGATAIEDKLQDGVPETIANLLSANIKVWILTGDKQETAINIGHSCKLLSQDVPLIILNTTDLDTTREEITKELADKKASSGDDAVSLIIDGKTLVHALNDSLRKDFIDLCSMCNAVICCRVSPIQKAEVVELVQEHTKAITLSIGDGANDVAMIQKAQVGVGISGNEGLQAANSADFAIAQFRFLQRLLFVHGAWNYTRISKVILYCFYKNICLYIIELWFAIYSFWTGQVLFERWTIGKTFPPISFFLFKIMSIFVGMYNLLFTGAPPIVIGLFDHSCNAKTRMDNPLLYLSSQKSEQFNNKIFWRWILLAVFHSVILYFLPMGMFGQGTVWPNGKDGDYLVCGNIVYSCVILTVCTKALMILEAWNIGTMLGIFGSIVVWFLFLVVYSYLWVIGLPLAANMAGMIELISTTPMFWLSLLLVPLSALLPDIVGKVGYTGIKPSETELVNLGEKSNNPAPYLDQALEKLRKETKALIEPIQQKIGTI